MFWNIWLKLKDSKIFWALVAGLVLFVGGYYAGNKHEPAVKVVEKTVEDTVSKQKLAEASKTVESLQQQLKIAESKITELKSNVKIVERVVKQKDGTIIIDKTTEKQTEQKTAENKNTDQNTNNTKVAENTKKTESENTTHKVTEKTTTPIEKSWFAGPAAVWVPALPVGEQFYVGATVGRTLGKIPVIDTPVALGVTVMVPTNKPISIPNIGAALTFGF